MAVSYVSTPFKSSPYVPPIDLNLMAKVLSIKQEKFDTTAAKIQSQLDTIANADILKGIDKDYVNSKLNNIVENINGLGGVDLGDINIGNQIGSFAASVYDDDKVMNAISSTKRIRALQSSYEKFKTDPKLIKYYSESNEYMDNKAVNAYMQDQNVGAAYGGTSTATRFYDYNKDFNDILSKVIPQQYTKITTGGGYMHKETGKIVSEDKIKEIAQGMLNPVQREQMLRDGVFLYEAKARYGKEDLVVKALQQRDGMIAQEEDILKRQKAALLAETKPSEKAKIKADITEREATLKSLQANRTQEAGYYSSLYDQNPNELMYKVYSGDYFNSLSKRYSVNSIDQTLAIDPVWKETYTQANLNERQKRDFQAASLLQAQRDKAAMERTLVQEGKKADGTPDNPLTTGNINSNTSTADAEKRKEVAIQKLNETDAAMGAIKEDFIATTMAENQVDRDTAELSFKMLQTAMAEKAQMIVPIATPNDGQIRPYQAGIINNLPKGFGEKMEQYNLLALQRKGLERAAVTGGFWRPQYLTRVITPDEQNNSKDANYGIYEAIKTQLKKEGKIQDTKNVLFKEAYATPDESGGYSISYVEGSGNKQTAMQEYKLTAERAKALGFVEPPNNLGILNRNVGGKQDFLNYIQNNNDPNFVAKVRVYEIKPGEYGAQYLYGDNVPINLLKNGNAATPADAYARASAYIKTYRAGDTKKNHYQTKLDFDRDLGITEEQRSESVTKRENEYKLDVPAWNNPPTLPPTPYVKGTANGVQPVDPLPRMNWKQRQYYGMP